MRRIFIRVKLSHTLEQVFIAVKIQKNVSYNGYFRYISARVCFFLFSINPFCTSLVTDFQRQEEKRIYASIFAVS